MYQRAALVLLPLILAAALGLGVYAQSTGTGSVGIDFVEATGEPLPPPGGGSGGRENPDSQRHPDSDGAMEDPNLVTVIDPSIPEKDVLKTHPKTGGDGGGAIGSALTGLLPPWLASRLAGGGGEESRTAHYTGSTILYI